MYEVQHGTNLTIHQWNRFLSHRVPLILIVIGGSKEKKMNPLKEMELCNVHHGHNHIWSEISCLKKKSTDVARENNSWINKIIERRGEHSKRNSSDVLNIQHDLPNLTQFIKCSLRKKTYYRIITWCIDLVACNILVFNMRMNTSIVVDVHLTSKTLYYCVWILIHIYIVVSLLFIEWTRKLIRAWRKKWPF